MKSHSYVPRKAKVTKRELLCNDVVALRLEFLDKKPFVFNPGQFIMLSVLGFGEIPIGITTSPKEKGYIEVAVRSVGMVTQKIWGLSVGDQVGVNGPFGNGFPLSKLKGKDVVIAAGGIGLAPLRSLIRHIEREPELVSSLTILNGARCPEKLLYREEYWSWKKFGKLFLTVDEGNKSWKEAIGRITVLFDLAEVQTGSVMVVCGPPIMFDPIVKRYAGKRVAEKDLYFLLERRMKCGVGKCQHCTCGKEYVCLDGPLFSYERIKYNKEALVN